MMNVCKQCHDIDSHAIRCVFSAGEHLRHYGAIIGKCEICGKTRHLIRCSKYAFEQDIRSRHMHSEEKVCSNCGYSNECAKRFHGSGTEAEKAQACATFITKKEKEKKDKDGK